MLRDPFKQCGDARTIPSLKPLQELSDGAGTAAPYIDQQREAASFVKRAQRQVKS